MVRAIAVLAISKRAIADNSCIGVLGNNIDIDFRQEYVKKPQKKTHVQMIVAASCGTKNNNASLQSNN